MCHPAYYPPYEKSCGHPIGVWCACTKYRSNDATEHLGDTPQDEEANVLRPADAERGYPRVAKAGESRGLDAVDYGDHGDTDRGYGAVESDSILTFG